MARMVSGLLNEVEQHPTQIDWLRQVQQDVSRLAAPLNANTGVPQVWSRAHNFLRAFFSPPICRDHIAQSDGAFHQELVFTRGNGARR